MDTITVRELRNNGAAVLARVARGETLTVTRDGDPVATVAPLPRRALSAQQLIARRAALPTIDAAGLRRDLDMLLDPDL